MFGLMTRSVRRTPPRPSPRTRNRLGLLRLEARDCPSVVGGSISDGPTPPTIAFTYTQGPQKTVIIDGTVTDDHPGNLPVTFSGAVQGTVNTGSDGHFHTTLTATSLSAFRAQVIDGAGSVSNVYEVTLTNVAPSIQNFKAVLGTGGWTITGTVSDEWAQGLTITFASSIKQVNGRTATVSYNDDFGVAFSLPKNSFGGDVTAHVTDWWGAQSDDVDFYIG